MFILKSISGIAALYLVQQASVLCGILMTFLMVKNIAIDDEKYFMLCVRYA